jgi:glycosyltransferase involved in cell wall biosynthesis
VNSYSVVLPAYNESEFIYANIVEAVNTLKTFNSPFEVIVVDDGSPDRTHLVALRAKELSPEYVRVIRYDQNRGKGHALLCGASYARGTHVVFLDADMDLHPAQLPVLFKIMDERNADIVVGSKLHRLSRVNYPRVRRLWSYGYYLLVRAMFGLPIRDTQTGIKVFRKTVLDRVGHLSRSEKFAFDVELLVLAHMFGFKVVDAPVTLNFQRQFGRVKFRDVVHVFIDTTRIFLRLRVFAPIVRDVAGIGVRHRLSGAEQLLEPPSPVGAPAFDQKPPSLAESLGRAT